MPRSARISRAVANRANTSAIAAIDKYFGQLTSLVIAGVTMTPAALKAVLQAELDTSKQVADTRALLRAQVHGASAAAKTAYELRASLRAFVLGSYGPKALAMLSDFRFAVPKPKGPRKVAAKLKGVIAAKATRAARHTMGKKQKRAIKGTQAAS